MKHCLRVGFDNTAVIFQSIMVTPSQSLKTDASTFPTDFCIPNFLDLGECLYLIVTTWLKKSARNATPYGKQTEFFVWFCLVKYII